MQLGCQVHAPPFDSWAPGAEAAFASFLFLSSITSLPCAASQVGACPFVVGTAGPERACAQQCGWEGVDAADNHAEIGHGGDRHDGCCAQGQRYPGARPAARVTKTMVEGRRQPPFHAEATGADPAA